MNDLPSWKQYHPRPVVERRQCRCTLHQRPTSCSSNAPISASRDCAVDVQLWLVILPNNFDLPKYLCSACADTQPYLPTVPFSAGQSRFGDRNPTSRPMTQKSRFVPICPDQRPKHGFKPALCLFSLFFSRNSSFFGVFWPFFMYPSVASSYPNKKNLYKRAFKLFILL